MKIEIENRKRDENINRIREERGSEKDTEFEITEI